MSQERLTDLAILSIESEESSKIDVADIAKEFAAAKVRRVGYLSDLS